MTPRRHRLTMVAALLVVAGQVGVFVASQVPAEPPARDVCVIVPDACTPETVWL